MVYLKNYSVILLLLTTLPLLATARNDDWRLVWSDEFNTEGRLSPSVWNYEQGYVRNEEAQWYQPDNAVCKGGFLVIEARKERNRQNPLYIPGSNDWRKEREFIEYTSSSVTTAGKKEFLYGRFEVRARIPVAKGAWPAIWTLGSNMEWPSCGEIDIMEYYQIKEFLIFWQMLRGARTSNGGLNGIVRPHPISILRRKIRNGLPNFTFGGWIGMKKLSNSIWMMNC